LELIMNSYSGDIASELMTKLQYLHFFEIKACGSVTLSLDEHLIVDFRVELTHFFISR
jgi:hypothetical protein